MSLKMGVCKSNMLHMHRASGYYQRHPVKQQILTLTRNYTFSNSTTIFHLGLFGYSLKVIPSSIQHSLIVLLSSIFRPVWLFSNSTTIFHLGLFDYYHLPFRPVRSSLALPQHWWSQAVGSFLAFLSHSLEEMGVSSQNILTEANKESPTSAISNLEVTAAENAAPNHEAHTPKVCSSEPLF